MTKSLKYVSMFVVFVMKEICVFLGEILLLFLKSIIIFKYHLCYDIFSIQINCSFSVLRCSYEYHPISMRHIMIEISEIHVTFSVSYLVNCKIAT